MQRRHRPHSFTSSTFLPLSFLRHPPTLALAPVLSSPSQESPSVFSVAPLISAAAVSSPSLGTVSIGELYAPALSGPCLMSSRHHHCSRVFGDSTTSALCGRSRETFRKYLCPRTDSLSRPLPPTVCCSYAFWLLLSSRLRPASLSSGYSRVVVSFRGPTHLVSPGGLLRSHLNSLASYSTWCRGSRRGGNSCFDCSVAGLSRPLTRSWYLLESRLSFSDNGRKPFLLAYSRLQRSPDPSVRPLKLVLVGRPNVGKSTLFNRLLSGTRGGALSATQCFPYSPQRLEKAIVSPQAGTTRDRKEARAVFGGLQLTLVDTGGLEDAETTGASELLKRMRKQVRVSLAGADCVLFVVDATEGITPVDLLLSRLVNEWVDEEQSQRLRALADKTERSSASKCFHPSSFVVRQSAAEAEAEKSAGGGLFQRHHAGAQGRVTLVAPPKRPATQRTAGTKEAGGGLQEGCPTRREGEQCTRRVQEYDGVTHAAASSETATGTVPNRTQTAAAVTAPGAVSRREEERCGEAATGASEIDLSGRLAEDCGEDRLPIILVVNKADGCFLGDYLADCYELHMGSPVVVSAKKNEGLDDLYDRLVLEIGHRQETVETVGGGRGQAADSEEEGDALETSFDDVGGGWTADEDERCIIRKSFSQAEEGSADNGTVGEAEPASEDLDRLLSRMGPPRPSEAAGAWVEGLARRYGECGIEETFKKFSDPSSSQYIPWDLSETSLAAAAATAAVERKARAAAKARTATASQVDSAAEARDSQTDPADGGGEEDEERMDENRPHNCMTREEVLMAEAEIAAASSLSIEASPASLRKRLRSKAARDHVLSLRRQTLFRDVIHVAVIGRPNVGKSTLVNALLEDERMVVDDRPGTTTDAIATDWKFRDHPFKLIDTAGVSRGWKLRHTDLLLEAGMQTLRNLRRSQVCILCVDGSQAEASGHPISSQELALAHLASAKEGRCLAVCVTKWDLVPESRREKVRAEILERLKSGLGHLKGCPVVFVAAKQGQNLETLMTKLLVVYRRWNARIPTSKLNAWLREFLLRWPPPWRLGSKCQIKYMTQVKARPPTFVAWSNVYSSFPVNYLRQVTNAMREEFSLAGTPLRLILRTTAMPTPGRKLSRQEVLKWKRLGPKQHKVVADLTRRYCPRKPASSNRK
ncbi:ribosome biogenesis gtpase der protein [Cystoisospora suis]|uniref:Ribosome biogenesis gtpase der protein n=1 Tax=Cystoisospora suis TaxID=483139 RepID=A0A2C6LFN8_9APIC|nr:ribosome biogenesis gtpase der protein [Cystoisospora suis]